MLFTQTIRRVIPIAVVAIVATATPSLAFEPSVLVTSTASGDSMAVTDIDTRGANLAVTIDAVISHQRVAILSSSTDRGLSWSSVPLFDVATRESQATVCNGQAVMAFTSADQPTPTRVDIISLQVALDGSTITTRTWTASGFARKPDIACVANDEVAAAWFQKDSSGYHVRLKTRRVGGHNTSPQTFDLGSGTVSRGLAVAASADEVYVAWFRGNELKLRRFSIGSTGSHTLTSLATSTIATLPYGNTPELDADGTRVILAYMDRASLKVRRSNSSGASFGSAQTLRPEPFPSEIGAFPITVAVHGSRVAIGGAEIGGIGTLTGRGLGYRSTNGGSSYSLVSSHTQGQIAAGLLKVGSSYHYAEVWDQSIADPSTQSVQFRRQ